MKITAGLGSIDDYIPYVEAGADEFFCGYVPHEWMICGGLNYPLNRREVLYYNVQIGSESEMEILSELVRQKKKPVTVALNALLYAPHQYPMIKKLICRLFYMGFSSFIVGDMALLVYLKQNVKEPIEIHISGELSEINQFMIDEVRSLGAKRIIFHRKVTPQEMKSCIGYQKEKYPQTPLEYEAFVLNEMCHFTGAFCSSLHCDELAPACRLPYRLIKIEGDKMVSEQNLTECTRDNIYEYDVNDYDASDSSVNSEENIASSEESEKELLEDESFENEYLLGRSGCGLCALWQLRTAGITHLKLVSRGNYTADTLEDIRRLRHAITILEESFVEDEYKKRMRHELFPRGCSHNCYYLMEGQLK